MIDDGSTNPIKGAIRIPKNMGYGNAIKQGILKSKTTHVAIIDADAQYDPVELLEMWESMTDEDMLIGKRVTHQGGWKRLLGRLFMRLSASLLAWYYIRDLNSGMRIFKRSLVRNYFQILCDTYSFTTTLTLALVLDGCKVRWTPIGFYPRVGTRSNVRMVYHGLIAMFHTMRLCFALRTRKVRVWLRNG